MIFRVLILLATSVCVWTLVSPRATGVEGSNHAPDLKSQSVNFAWSMIYPQKYKHKSEAEIAAMTPSQRVDEWVNEQLHHQPSLSDDYDLVIKKYILRDGLKALPRIIDIMDEYDLSRFSEGKGKRGERFDACIILFSYLDELAVRLRGSENGRRAIDSLKRAIDRMRAAGYERKELYGKWVYGRLEVSVIYFQQAEGINDTDEAIRNTLRLEKSTRIADAELLEFSNFLVARYPEYPSWSERDFIKIDEAGKPMPGLVVKKLQRFYEAYLEFKKTKR
jgi:hypothetical protein